jgi:hypothetical protein
VAGVFGHGPVATSEVRSSDGRLEVEYERIARHASERPLRLTIRPGPARDTTVDVWISREFVEGLNIRRIEPEASEEHAGDSGTTYRFRVSDPTRPAHIAFHVEPEDLGGRRATIGLVNGDSVRFKQYVLP